MRSNDAASIRPLSLFRGMTDERFEAIVQPAFLQRFPPHVMLFERGTTPDFLHVVLDGSVELFARHRDRETTVDVLRPVTSFVVAAAVLRQPVLMSARTLETSRILMIPVEMVQQAMQSDLRFAQAIIHEIAHAYRGMVKDLKSQKLRTSVERLANWILCEQARQGHGGSFEIPFDKRTLASRLGMTPENLSRNFATLTRHGVEVQGRTIRVTDPQSLMDLARPDPLIDDPEPTG